MGETPVTYELVSTTEWAEDVRSTFGFMPAGEAWDYIGTCPRCGHQISRRLETRGTTTYRTESAARDGMVVRCNCGSEHPGRPDGSRGCGAYGTVELEWP